MKRSLFVGFMMAAMFSLAFISCERDEPEPGDGGNGGTAGKGGAATLNVVSKHHSRNITDMTVYITYNAATPPDHYDDSAKAADKAGVPIATFTGLKKGSYYLTAKGYDPDIDDVVKGGIPFNVADEKSYDLTIAVSEPHK